MRAAVAALGFSVLTALPRPAPAAGVSPAAAASAVAPALSPDGERVAFVSDVSGLPQVWVAPVEGGWPAQLTHGGEPAVAVSWSPDGKWLAFAACARGGASRLLYAVRPDGRGRRRFTSPGAWSRLGRWSPDGAWIGFASAPPAPPRLVLGLYQPAASTVRYRFTDSSPVRPAGVSPDGRRLLVERFSREKGWQIYLRSLQRRREVLLTPHRERAFSGGALFSPAGDAVYLVTDAETGRRALARVRLDAGEPRGGVQVLAQRDDADLETLAAPPGARWGALLWNAGGRSELGLVDLATGRILPGPELPAEVVHGVSVTPDGARIAVSVSGPASPPDVWILDRRKGTAAPVAGVPHGGLELGELARPRRVRFRSHDGVELDGWLYRAPGPAGALVVALHDGLEGQARPGFRPLLQALVQSGLSVLDLNVRGSGGRGRDFAAMDDGPQRLNAIRDVAAGAEWAVASGHAERGRLGVLGRGHGGYLALAAVTERPKLFAAGVVISGFADLESLLAAAPPRLAPVLEAEYGDPEEQRDMLRALSPIHRLDRVRTPVLLIHGRNNPVAPVEQAERVHARLEAAGAESSLVVFDDEGRGFLRRRNRLRVARLVVRWFESRLAR